MDQINTKQLEEWQKHPITQKIFLGYQKAANEYLKDLKNFADTNNELSNKSGPLIALIEYYFADNLLKILTSKDSIDEILRVIDKSK